MVFDGRAIRPPGRGDFLVSNFHPGPTPGNLGETIFGVRKVARAEGVTCFWDTSLEKIIGGVTVIIWFRLKRMDAAVCRRSEVCYPRSEAREDRLGNDARSSRCSAARRLRGRWRRARSRARGCGASAH